MHKKILIRIFLVLLLSGLPNFAQAKPKDKNIQSYLIDMNLDGKKEILEIEDKFLADRTFLVTVREKNKTKDIIDRVIISGKLRKMELVDLNDNTKQQLVLQFDTAENVSDLVIYDFKNNKFTKIFAVSSNYGVDTDFSTVPRIKVGKPAKTDSSANLLPDWDIWIWVGDKFIKE